jgi:transcriptional regulator with XRE-family HTH domain
VLAMDSNKDIFNLGQLISKLRKEKGYSQRRFAQISGLSNTTISRIENGETHNPDIETLKLLAAHLDYPITELIKYVDLYNIKDRAVKHAKLKFLHQPVKKITRYSTVRTSLLEEEEEQLKEHTMQQISEVETPKTIALKGMRLITLRLERNITQKELAEALGIDKTLISQYEGEIIKPDYSTVQKLADFFGVAVEYLTDSPIIEMSSCDTPKDLFRNITRDQVLQTKGLRPEYAAIAEEIQAAGIEIEDVRAFIEMIKKYKGLSL